MSLYTASRFCVSPHRKAYPNLLRRISTSQLDSRSIPSLSPSSLRSPGSNQLQKGRRFASLSVKPSTSNDARALALQDDSAPAVTDMRSISLFAPRTAARISVSNPVIAPSPTLIPLATLESPQFGGLPSISVNKSSLDSADGPPQPSVSVRLTSRTRKSTAFPPHSIAHPMLPAACVGLASLPPPLVCPELSVASSTSSESSLSSSDLPSPTARARRAPPPSSTPPMHVMSSTTKHTLDVCLPTEIQPEMVTISAKKGDRLDVVADAWHLENDCHYEWEIRFPPRDIDMSSVHAKFNSEGHLTIDVQRRGQYHGSLYG